MSDILNFRLARAPQRQVPKLSLDLYPLPASQGDNPPGETASVVMRRSSGPTSANAGRFGGSSFLAQLLASGSTGSRTASATGSRAASAYVTSPAFLGGGAPLDVPLRELDSWLTANGNRVEPSDISKFLKKKLTDIVQAPNWVPMRQALADSLIASMLADVDPAIRGELARLILIAGLLEALIIRPPQVVTKEGVFNQLRWRTIVIPREILQLTNLSSRLARRYGFSDYYLVREEWNEYRAGEIAHIENALAGEFRERSTTQLTQTETTDVTESETSKSEERDTQTTDRLELQQHTQEDISIAAHVDGKVDTSGQYGPTKVDTHIGGSFDYARSEATERATTQAHETVARAITKVEERTRTVRSQRQLSSFEDKNLHRIDNTAQGSKPMTGIYRWVDKIQRLQIFRFPHRFLLEFQIPEPATFVRWRRAQQTEDFANPEPQPLIALSLAGQPEIDANGRTKPLGPWDVHEATYLYYVERYQIAGIDPPPPVTLAVSTMAELKQTVAEGTDLQKSSEDMTYYDLVAPGGTSNTVPAGYRLRAWAVRLQSYAPTGKWGDPLTVGDFVSAPEFLLAVGQDVVRFGGERPVTGGVLTWAATSPPFGIGRENIVGTVPITFAGHFVREFRAHLQLDCERLPDHFVKWQLQTFETIVAAYTTMKVRHDEEKASRSVGQGVAIEGDSPGRNAEVVREELKRAVIRLVSNGQYPPVNALTQDVNEHTGPVLDLDFAAKSAPAVQFVEQAFEWENLSYVLYPYYWATERNWKALADIEGADPEFARFLRSGSARVVVPARPNFEDQVRMYVDLGALWGGGPVPAVGDPEYLSIAEEIKAQRQAPGTGEAGEWWDVKLPTTLVALDSDSTLPKKNPAPTLGPPPVS
ncbi:MAG: hypothetical protein HZA69_08490 [Gammaproteobacteria bacterium]|nr:hypothetical protein [Gammaproteobacteria bacterium]